MLTVKTRLSSERRALVDIVVKLAGIPETYTRIGTLSKLAKESAGVLYNRRVSLTRQLPLRVRVFARSGKVRSVSALV